MSTQVKQEGDFKIKSKKTTPKKLGNQTENIAKLDLTKPGNEQGAVVKPVEKVIIPNEALKKEDNAIRTQETNDSNAIVEESKDSGNSETVVEEVRTTEEKIEETPIIEVTETEEKEIQQEVAEAKRDKEVLGKELPENIEKLVNFMEETGGNIQDYVRLNADYSKLSDSVILKEYYNKTKPYLEGEDIDLLLEDFSYDEELDEPKDIRKKKIAYKEEIGKARSFLEETKSKYYDEIKLRPGVTQEQKKATDFFNRYNQELETNKAKHERFKTNTKDFFENEFKGFDFQVGEKKFRYNVKDPNVISAKQQDISKVIGKFLNKNGEVTNHSQYHKALYAADNADTLVNHFYEQGKADALKEQIAKSRNMTTEPRQTSGTGDVFVKGLKVRAISGSDSTKLRIKNKKFNN